MGANRAKNIKRKGYREMLEKKSVFAQEGILSLEGARVSFEAGEGGYAAALPAWLVITGSRVVSGVQQMKQDSREGEEASRAMFKSMLGWW